MRNYSSLNQRPASSLLGWVILSLSALALSFLPISQGCSHEARPPKLLLVGIDGADWNIIRPLLARNEMPNLLGIVKNGVHGPLRSFKPLISPVVWTTIATGKGPDKHGVLDFTMPDPETGAPIIVTSTIRRSKAFWNILSEQGLSVCVIGWWATWPAETVRGALVSDRLNYHAFIETPEAREGLVYPSDLQDEILGLRMDPAEVSYDVAKRFMDISEEEFEAAPELDFSDPISHFRHIYATMETQARIAEFLARRIHPDVLAVYFEGVDTAGHMYMRYAPPPYPGTTEQERRKFGHTVEAFYRYQDQLLGRLLDLTGNETTVMIVSDHGFLSGRARPLEKSRTVDYATAARWHRLDGVFAAKGPRIRAQDPSAGITGIITSATVFDITPTMLALLDLPVASDMEGKVIEGLLRDGVPRPKRIASYEDESWRESRREAARSVQAVDEEMKERLRSLGYIGAGESEEAISARGIWSLGDYYMYKGDFGRAEEQFDKLRDVLPDYAEPYYNLGIIYMRRGEVQKAARMFEAALEREPEMMEVRLNLAFVYTRLGQPEKAVELLQEGLRSFPEHTGARVNLGIVYAEMGRTEEARRCFEEVLEIDPENHGAHAQLGLLLEKQGRTEEALEHWRAALRIAPNDKVAKKHVERLSASVGR